MAPAYQVPDLTKVKASFTVLPKNDYEFVVGEPKAFKRTNPEGKTSVGVRYPVNVVAPESHLGARQMYSCYVHTEGAMQFAKQFIMACLGYNPKSSEDEDKFDTKFAGADWSLDPDSGSVGDVWREINGTHVIFSVDTQLNPNNGEPSQQFVSCRPVVAVNS